MAHPLGRFKIKVVAAQPSKDKDGLPQVMLTVKSEFGTVTTYLGGFAGARGDQRLDISMRHLEVLGLPDGDLTQLDKIIGKDGLVDIVENESNGRIYTNVNIVDPDYVPKPKPFDQLEWKKLAARLKHGAPAQEGEKLEF